VDLVDSTEELGDCHDDEQKDTNNINAQDMSFSWFLSKTTEYMINVFHVHRH
jgi:hypothetical protein